MGRKLFTVFLVLSMVMVMMPTTAFAADDTEYVSWTDADSLPTKGVYKLNTDVILETEFSSYPTLTGDLTLDLNGHKITVAGYGQYAYYVNNKSYDLVLEDSAGGGIITNEGITDTSRHLIQVNAGSLTLKGGTLENTTKNGYALYVNSGSSAYIEGGEVVNKGSNGYAAFVNSGSTLILEDGVIKNTINGGNAVYANGNTTFEMSGGTVQQDSTYASAAAIDANNTASSIIITGGTVKSGSKGIYAAFTPVSVTGGIFDTKSYTFHTRNTTVDPAEEGSVTVISGDALFYTFNSSHNIVRDGNFNVPYVVKEYTSTTGTDELLVTGGTFSGAVNKEDIEIYLGDGYAVDSAGSVIPATEPSEDSVAVADGIYYKTLSGAIENVDEGGTVSLVSSIEAAETIRIPDGKDFTLDIGQYNITNADTYTGSSLITIAGTVDIKGDGRIETSIGNGVRVNSGELDISGNVNINAPSGQAVIGAGANITINDNAIIEGEYAVTIYNSDIANGPESESSQLTVNGGRIIGTLNGIAGNNLQSAGSIININGGVIEGSTAIYIPMESTVVIGGDAEITGGTAIEAKMGDITIQGNPVITGTGEWNEDEPENGGTSPEGSAFLGSAQMYGQNGPDSQNPQYINSPDLKVTILGGTFISENGNAITVYNTESTNEQDVSISVTGGDLQAAEGKGAVRYITVSDDENDTSYDPTDGTYVSSKSNTSIKVGGGAAMAAVDVGGETTYYATVEEALAANTKEAEELEIFVIASGNVDSEALKSENVTLITAPGVELGITSAVDGMIVQIVENADGTRTYTLVEAGELVSPSVDVEADKTTVHQGEKITLTAKAEHSLENVTFTYQWYKGGVPVEGATGETLEVTESGDYHVVVSALSTTGNATLISAETASEAVRCTVEPHDFGESWESNASGHWHECSICETKVDQESHQFGAWTVVKEATSDKAGSRMRECSVCGYQQTEAISPTGTGDGQDGAGDDEAPKTGDDMNITTWLIIMLAAAGTAALIRRKERR